MSKLRRPLTRRFGGLVMLLLVAVIATGCMGPFKGDSYEYFGGTYDPQNQAAPINLTDQNGDPFSLNELSGSVVLLYFGYTWCPDFCPTTLLDIQRVEEHLGEDAEDVEVVFVSVDPERDTPQRLREYMDFFGPDYYAVTGAEEEIRQVARDYNIMYAKRESDEVSGYLVDHSTSLFAIDRDGDLALTWAYGTEVDNITDDVQHLLDE